MSTLGSIASSGVAAVAPTVGVVGNGDLTITVMPTADSNGLRECEFGRIGQFGTTIFTRSGFAIL